MENRNYDGSWWVPENADNTVGGQFAFSATSGGRLEALGVLSDAQLGAIADVRVPVIHGTISAGASGNDVTLLDCHRGGTRLHGRYGKQQFIPSVAVIGAHLTSIEQLKIRTCEVGFTQLPNWLAWTGFEFRLPKGRWRVGKKLKYTLKYTPITFPVIRTPIGTIRFVTRSLPPLGPTRSYALQEWVGLQFRPRKPLAFHDFRRGPLWYPQNFFTFAADHRNTTTSVYANLVGVADAVELLFGQRSEADAPAQPLEMLFCYPDIAARAPQVFSQWFDLYDRLGPALNSAYSVLYSQIASVDTRFLNVIQAVESYDRRTHGAGAVTPEEHQERVARIVAGAPDADVEWLTGKLSHSYEAFLNERLLRFFERLGRPFWSRMFASRTKMKRQLWKIAEWRNALTHVTSTVDEISADILFLHVATNQLLTGLKANLLLDLGFSTEDLRDAFKHNQMYLFFSQQAAE